MFTEWKNKEEANNGFLNENQDGKVGWGRIHKHLNKDVEMKQKVNAMVHHEKTITQYYNLKSKLKQHQIGDHGRNVINSFFILLMLK